MAIYYIDPHTTTNGTGTWASPWWFGATARTTFADGDEIRIKGVALSSLLTATTYTATYTTFRSLTITAGGNLGADFAAGDIVYLPGSDAFFKVGSSSANVIAPYGTLSPVPWYNTSSGQTNITVRKVNTASYGASTGGVTINTLGASSVVSNNLTISDCWTSETTRVTDGSVKTLIHSTATSTSLFIYPDTSSFISSITTGRAVNWQNTHFVSNNAACSANFVMYGSGTSVSVNQIQTCGDANLGTMTIGGSSLGSHNVSITFNHLNSAFGLSGNVSGNNISLTVNNWTSNTGVQLFSGSNLFASNVTATINTVVTSDANANMLLSNNVLINNYDVSFTGPVEIYSSTTPGGIWGAYGTNTVAFGSGFSCKRSQRTVSITSFSSLWTTASTIQYPKIMIPSVPAPSGITFSQSQTNVGSVNNAYHTNSKYIPSVVELSLPGQIASTPRRPTVQSRLANMVVSHRNGDAPYELLGIASTRYPQGGNLTWGNFPVVSMDATTFRTAGPSLQSYLATRITTYWVSGASVSAKSIKIPVTTGVSCSVSGYVSTDQTGFVNGDCVMRLIFLETQVASQSMTTSCINAWEQFTLTFTPSYSGEAILIWEQYFSAGAKSYWLDDLTVT